jgi:hypothetical protein
MRELERHSKEESYIFLRRESVGKLGVNAVATPRPREPRDALRAKTSTSSTCTTQAAAQLPDSPSDSTEAIGATHQLSTHPAVEAQVLGLRAHFIKVEHCSLEGPISAVRLWVVTERRTHREDKPSVHIANSKPDVKRAQQRR